MDKDKLNLLIHASKNSIGVAIILGIIFASGKIIFQTLPGYSYFTLILGMIVGVIICNFHNDAIQKNSILKVTLSSIVSAFIGFILGLILSKILASILFPCVEGEPCNIGDYSFYGVGAGILGGIIGGGVGSMSKNAISGAIGGIIGILIGIVPLIVVIIFQGNQLIFFVSLFSIIAAALGAINGWLNRKIIKSDLNSKRK